jgi:hypothetical protein
MDKYESRRHILPGLLATSGLRERIWIGVALAALVYAGAASWRHTTLLAAQQLKAARCEPQVMDSEGNRVSTTPLSELEVSQVDGIVVARLSQAMKCIRGLDSKPEVVQRCWNESTPLFVGEESSRKLTEYQRDNFGSAQETLARLREETVEIAPKSWGRVKTDPKSKGKQEANGETARYWLRWEEQHRNRSGKALGNPEVWSGTFDVELAAPDTRSGNWNPLRILGWSWQRDLVGD